MTNTATTQRLRWWQVLGPWPLRPLAAAFTMWLYTAAFSSGRVSALGNPFVPGEMASIFVKALVPAVLLGVYFALLRRFAPGVQRRLWTYIVVVLIGVAGVLLTRYWLGELPIQDLESARAAVVLGLIRNFALIAVLQSAIGIGSWRLAQQVERTNAALEDSRAQQERLLDADERVRRQVSILLHDKVQAGLIAACLELQDLSSNATATQHGEIESVISRLEELRALDVRRAARALSPDLTDTDLQAALDELGAQYAPGMRVAIHVEPSLLRHDSRPDAQLLLGSYRIIEQAILNSAIHGRARHCDVDVRTTPSGIELRIDDDGIGMVSDRPAGLGTTLMTTWTRILGGEWSRANRATGGVTLSARLPIS